MENRFRFRAWDTEEKRMIYYNSLTYGNSYKQLCADQEDSTDTWIDDHFANDDKLILMQCTGLKIKDKLLYEGDRIRCNNKSSILQGDWEVCFVQGGFSIMQIDGCARHCLDSFDELEEDLLDYCEIIGNVFEPK